MNQMSKALSKTLTKNWSVAVLVLLSVSSPAWSAVQKSSLPVTVLGKPDATIKGTLQTNLKSEPETLNPSNATDGYSRDVYKHVVEGLLFANVETLAFEPMLAERYEVSKDGLTFTFYLNKNAKFSDDKPVTAEDVKFSFEYPKDVAYGATHRIPYLENIDTIETPDAHTVIFKMKKKYFKNLEVLASNLILPKHMYVDPKKKHANGGLYGSGAYMLETYNRGKNVTLVRNPKYWGQDLPHIKPTAKFERINFRFIKEDNLQIEMMKKGQIDYVDSITPENFEKKAVGEPFGTTIKKMQVENDRPKNYGFVGLNNKHAIFGDKNVRLAMAHLFNRQAIIDKFSFGKAVLAKGPVYYKSATMPQDVKPFEFNPAKANELLKKAGWADADKNQILEKMIDGQKKEFRFDLMLANPDAVKYFTMYKEDLAKAGIEMNIRIVEWNAFLKSVDERKFDAVSMSWGGGSPESDLKQIWHSESARPGGSNYISYSNPEVDKAIDLAREEMDLAKRTKHWQKAVRLIAQDVPYIFMTNFKYDLYLVNNRIGMDKPTYRYDIGSEYWFLTN